jgi:hypothetical protein
LSARLGKYNAIEERKAKLKEKKSENKNVLEIIQCAIQFGNSDQKVMGTQLLTQKLRILKQKLDEEQMKYDLASLDMGEDVNATTAEQFLMLCSSFSLTALSIYIF